MLASNRRLSRSSKASGREFPPSVDIPGAQNEGDMAHSRELGTAKPSDSDKERQPVSVPQGELLMLGVAAFVVNTTDELTENVTHEFRVGKS